MGGRALSAVARRMERNEYLQLSEELLSGVAKVAGEYRVEILPSYFSKRDFGDIDVLVDQRLRPREGQLLEAIGAVESTHNGSTTSAGLLRNGLIQVDLNYTAIEWFDFARGYFGFNDLGNIIGRVAHWAGFKLGHKGLRYVVRDDENPDYVMSELTITRDWDQALNLLGYDPEEYRYGANGGFQEPADMFRFAVSSRYSSRNIYLLENASSATRTRDRKRTTYREFLLWLDHPGITLNTEVESKADIRDSIMNEAMKQYPKFAIDYQNAHEELRNRKLAHRKFNGVLVGRLTGLSGKELGVQMKNIVEQFGGKAELQAWVLGASEQEIEELVLRQIPSLGITT
jgi:hypothetical protein